MSGIREPMGAGEKVLTVLRKQGETMKPADVRCQAVDESGEGGRCDNDITLDMETGTWLVWCEDHQMQEQEARDNGGERVERVEAGNLVSTNTDSD